jgi:flavorubredoxin
MAKAVVLFATRTGQTRSIAQKIVEGMSSDDIEVTLVNVTDFEKEKIDPQRYDAIVLGAPTYHGEMIQSMKTLLFSLEKANLEGKVGGAFGAFGWSGESPDRIYDTMKHVFKMDMVSGPLRLWSVSMVGGIKMAQDYGMEIAKKIRG